MKERRQPTRREWAAITSRRPVVRRIPKPESEEERLDRIAVDALDAHLEDEDTFRRWEQSSTRSAARSVYEARI